jgi:anti-sigma28 factor (negative regulator of flagellin synthesis)
LHLGDSMDVKKVSDSVELTGQLSSVRGQTPKDKAPPKAALADKAAKGDTLAISDEAQEKAKIARYVRIVTQLPDVREDKVAEAKRKLAAGEYNRPEVADRIADAMLEE